MDGVYKHFIDVLRACPDEWVHDPHCDCTKRMCERRICIKRQTSQIVQILGTIDQMEVEYNKNYMRRLIKKEEYKTSGNIPHWFVTVTWKPGMKTPEEAWECLKECTKSHDLDGGIAGLEYFSDKSPDGGHLHFHLLAPKSSKYKPITIREWCAKICDVPINVVDTGKNTNTFANRVNYICGLKQEGKQDYCKKDREWRDLHNLPRIHLEFTKELVERFQYAIDFVRA